MAAIKDSVHAKLNPTGDNQVRLVGFAAMI